MQRIGATAVVMRRFDAEDALRTIQDQQGHRRAVRADPLPPLLSLPEDARAKYDLSSLRVAIHAAAPCPMPLKEAMIALVGRRDHGVLRRDRGRRHPDPRAGVARAQGLGRPPLGGRRGAPARRGRRRVRRARNARAPCTSTRPRTQSARFSYHKDPQKTASTYRGSLFTIGDIGYKDADGYLYLTDRQSNMIISGGVNIYPQETENHLVMHPKVQDVAVIGVPNEDLGEEVKAVVVPAPGVASERRARARADRVLPRAASRTTSVRARSTSRATCRAPRRARWPSGGCARSTGPAARAGSV